MSSAIDTTIVTSGLFLVLLVVVVGFSMISQVVLADSIRIRLGEISNQVASDMIEVVSLCYQSTSADVRLFRPLKIPTSVGTYGYAIRLRLDGNVWVVEASLETGGPLPSTSPLWQQSGDMIVVTQVGTVHIGSQLIDFGPVLHSGSAFPVVWATRDSNGVTKVGLGEMRS